MKKRYFYNDGKEITSEEAHALEDKSGIMTSDKPIEFKTAGKKIVKKIKKEKKKNAGSK